MRLLRAAVLRRCAFAGSLPGLERRRIAAPRLRTRHRGEVRLARWSMVRHNLSSAMFAAVSKREGSQKLGKYFRFASEKRTSKVNSLAGPSATAANRAHRHARRRSPGEVRRRRRITRRVVAIRHMNAVGGHRFERPSALTAAMIRDACRRVGERVAGSRSQRHGNADPVRERETPLHLPMWIIL
jgi:hypothetical protein